MSNSKSQGINIYFSHSVERLADLLGDKIHQQQAQIGPFDAVNVLVPNGNMQRYLQLHVAERKGVCAQVEFPFLETGLFHLTQQITNQTKDHLNGTLLSWKIWSFLKRIDDQDDEIFAPIQRYLNTGDSNGLTARKQFQLSQKLARLLLDYESQRPEMVRLWKNNKLVFQNSKDSYLSRLELMQKKLYQKTVQADENQSTLLQMANDLHQAKHINNLPAIHVFTPSRISQLHRQLLLQLSEFIVVNIYQLNVCMEYWEDMQTKGEQDWYQSQLTRLSKLKVEVTDEEGNSAEGNNQHSELFAELALNPDDNELLQAWGKPGRETLKLFSEIENDAVHYSIEFYDHWIETQSVRQSVGQCVLHEIQSHIITRTPKDEAIIQPKQIDSIQFAVAPSIVREVEATYNSVLWNLQQNPDLKLNEIVVLVTDMNNYRFVLEQVFESLNHQHQLKIKYAIVDSNAEMESQYAAAVSGLFKVLEDDFIRASLFEWLDNPCIQAANHFSQKDWDNWLLAVDKLGIYCGYESLYETENDSNSKLFTWQNGLEVLRKSLVFDDIGSSAATFLNAEKIGQLSVIIESLHGYQQRLKTTLKALQWEHLINDMLDALIVVPEEQNKEQVVQMALQQGLQKLALKQPDLLLNYQDIKLFIQHQLQEIPANKGNYLSGGVVCAALQPMRPIPFKLTYILGMDEKSFPGQLNQETLDLTNRSRRIGDINAIENNQYLFLETLMCSREKLYLSYVGTDLVKDEVIEPSPVFTTLKDYCNSVIDFDQLPFKTYPVSQIPLSSHNDSNFEDTNLNHIDWLVNFSYIDYLMNQTQYGSTDLPMPNSPIQQHNHEIFEAQLAHLKTTNEVAIEAQYATHRSIDADELARYLTNPQIAILEQLGIATKHDDDLSLVEQEPVKLLPLIKHKIFTGAINRWLLQPATADFNQLLKECHQVELKQSKAPLSLFAGLNQMSMTAQLLEKKLKPKLIDKTYVGAVQVGEIETIESPTILASAIEFDGGDGNSIEINGLSDNVFSADGFLTDMVVASSSSKKTKWNSKLLSPFINWCLWQLSPAFKVAEEFNVHMVFPEAIHSVILRPWFANEISFSSPSTIKLYLQELIKSYLKGEDEFIPVELANQLKIPTKSEQQRISFLAPTSKAKENVFMAYEILSIDDKKHLLDIYTDKLDWPEFQEVLKTIEYNESQQPWQWIYTNLLPLFAMVEGKFSGKDGDLS